MPLVGYKLVGCGVVGMTFEEESLSLPLGDIEVVGPTFRWQDEGADVMISGIAHLLHLVGNCVNPGIGFIPEFLYFRRSAVGEPRCLTYSKPALRFEILAPFGDATLESDVIYRALTPDDIE